MPESAWEKSRAELAGLFPGEVLAQHVVVDGKISPKYRKRVVSPVPIPQNHSQLAFPGIVYSGVDLLGGFLGPSQSMPRSGVVPRNGAACATDCHLK